MAGLARASRLAFSNGNALTNAMKKTLMQPQTAGIATKEIRDLDGIKRPAPFDYKNKNFNLFRSIFDKTHKRIDENSVVSIPTGFDQLITFLMFFFFKFS